MAEHITSDSIIAEALIGTTIDYTKDRWSSDWNGYEVGFDDVDVVGLYSLPDSTISYYVNVENGYVLDAWADKD